MMEIDVLGIDLAKRVFQLHGGTQTGVVVHRSKVSRPALFEAIARLDPKLVVMEARSSAYHWARRLRGHGIDVRLISPQYVAPFVKTNKNDRNDAEAIVEAASRPSMRFVTIKTIQQQDIQALHRLRQLRVHHLVCGSAQTRPRARGRVRFRWLVSETRGSTCLKAPSPSSLQVPPMPAWRGARRARRTTICPGARPMHLQEHFPRIPMTSRGFGARPPRWTTTSNTWTSALE
jgi:hypothetical protein